MDKSVKKRLEERGWQVDSSPQELLGLSDEEMRIVEWRVGLSKMLRERRKAIGCTQTALAKKLGSSQSRIAKIEAWDSSVSIDLILKSLFNIGVSNKEISEYISSLT